MENYHTQRAIRRHHIERLKKKRKNYWWGDLHGGLNEKQLGMVVSTPRHCSCWMCGNPRKYFGHKTRQEIMASTDVD